MALINTRILMAEQVSKRQLLPTSVSRGWAPIAPAFLEISPRSAGRSDSGSFQSVASALGLRVSEILCASFESGDRFLQHSWKKALSLQSQLFWGLAFLVHDPNYGSQMWGSVNEILVHPLKGISYPLSVTPIPCLIDLSILDVL